jgi:hypothetical protein
MKKEDVKTYQDTVSKGPLFIVGMPRSGTKLVRDLLNNHPFIYIAEIETNFLQIWQNKWSKYGDLSKLNNFKKFYNKMKKYTYFMYMEENNKLIKYYDWYHLCKDYTIQDVYESLIRHDTNISNHNVIWGDKSPDYLRYLKNLNDLFPEARFIHIIRDVRDYCLSINKTWGKNMLRGAQRWCNNINEAQKTSKILGSRYIEIKYENLITDSESVLKALCDFLKIDYDNKMINLKKPVENIGDAKKLKKIKSDNKDKFIRSMDIETKYKIEAIAGNMLRKNRYNVEYSGKTFTLSRLKMIYYQIQDFTNRVKFNTKQKGIVGGVKWTINSLLQKKPFFDLL